MSVNRMRRFQVFSTQIWHARLTTFASSTQLGKPMNLLASARNCALCKQESMNRLCRRRSQDSRLDAFSTSVPPLHQLWDWNEVSRLDTSNIFVTPLCHRVDANEAKAWDLTLLVLPLHFCTSYGIEMKTGDFDAFSISVTPLYRLWDWSVTIEVLMLLVLFHRCTSDGIKAKTSDLTLLVLPLHHCTSYGIEAFSPSVPLLRHWWL